MPGAPGRLDFVLGSDPAIVQTDCSDVCACDSWTQGGANLRCAPVGSALGYDVLPLQGRLVSLDVPDPPQELSIE